MSDSTTMELALGLARRAPAYFQQDLRPWMAASAWSERITSWALDALLLHRWSTRVLAATPTAPLRHAEACVSIAAASMINQRHARFEAREGIHEGIFWRMGWARLVRGYSSCEGQNFLLAALLSRRLQGVKLFEIQGPRGSEHTLVRLPLAGHPTFADAWGDAPLYRLSPASKEDPVPSLESLHARGLQERQGVYPAEGYRRGRAVSFSLRGALARPWRVAPASTSDGTSVDSSWWRLWLEARVHHLLGNPDDALLRYQELHRSAPRPWLRQIVEGHQKRLSTVSSG